MSGKSRADFQFDLSKLGGFSLPESDPVAGKLLRGVETAISPLSDAVERFGSFGRRLGQHHVRTCLIFVPADIQSFDIKFLADIPQFRPDDQARKLGEIGPAEGTEQKFIAWLCGEPQPLAAIEREFTRTQIRIREAIGDTTPPKHLAIELIADAFRFHHSYAAKYGTEFIHWRASPEDNQYRARIAVQPLRWIEASLRWRLEMHSANAFLRLGEQLFAAGVQQATVERTKSIPIVEQPIRTPEVAVLAGMDNKDAINRLGEWKVPIRAPGKPNTYSFDEVRRAIEQHRKAYLFEFDDYETAMKVAAQRIAERKRQRRDARQK